MKIEFTLNPQSAFNKIFTNDVLAYANERLYFYCNDYVPYRDGNLSKNVNISKDGVEYLVPYASKVYEGDKLKFIKDHHPLATSYWDRAMAVSKGQQLADDIQAYIER